MLSLLVLYLGPCVALYLIIKIFKFVRWVWACLQIGYWEEKARWMLRQADIIDARERAARTL